MELLIAILLWLGLIQPGSYTQCQIDARICASTAQIQTVQSDPVLLQSAQATNTSVITVHDPLEIEE